MSKPYKDVLTGNVKVRTFSGNTIDEELVWHRDANDRLVEVVSSSGWQLQLEDELPRVMNEGDKFWIPRDEWHRLIKGNGDLVIKIRESRS